MAGSKVVIGAQLSVIKPPPLVNTLIHKHLGGSTLAVAMLCRVMPVERFSRVCLEE